MPQHVCMEENVKRTIWYILVGIVLVAAAIGGILLLRRERSGQQEVRSAIVGRGPMLVTVSASGSIEPRRHVELAFEVPGRVAEVAVRVGDAVNAGQMLARLDTADLEFAVRQAEIGLQAAQLRLERLQEPPDEADIQAARAAVSDAAAAYETARMNLTLTENSVEVGDAVRAARAARDEAYRVYQDLQARFEAHDPLVSEQMVTTAYDAYLNALGAYNRAVENADLQLENARNGVTRAYNALVQAQNNLDRLLEGASDADVEAARLDVEAATLNLERARWNLDRATLSAPFAGVVAAVHVTPGSLAPTGLPAVVLLDTSRFDAQVNVDEVDIASIAVGQQVTVTVEGMVGVEISGTVERIAPAASLEGGVVYYEVYIALEPTTAPIRADMTVNATILVEELSGVLLIPAWVVRVDRVTGQTYVQRQTADGYERVNVTLGVRYGGLVQVLDGLSEGDVIALIEESNGLGLMRP